MTKEYSPARPFESKRGGGFLSAAQFLTETLMIQAAARRQRVLPDKFWNMREWKQHYIQQIQIANQLLKIYSVRSILAALRDQRCHNVYSFKAPWLDEVIQEYEDKLAEGTTCDPEPEVISIHDEDLKTREPRPKSNKSLKVLLET